MGNQPDESRSNPPSGEWANTLTSTSDVGFSFITTSALPRVTVKSDHHSASWVDHMLAGFRHLAKLADAGDETARKILIDGQVEISDNDGQLAWSYKTAQSTAERARAATKWLVRLVVLVYACYDLLVYLAFGAKATISSVIGSWLAAPWYGFYVCVILGGLTGHLFGQMPYSETTYYWVRLGLAAVAFVAMYALALSRP